MKKKKKKERAEKVTKGGRGFVPEGWRRWKRSRRWKGKVWKV